MNIYVDKKPKSCENCPFCEYFNKNAHGKGRHEVACFLAGTCENILFGNKISPKNCSLKTLKERDEAIRKKTISDIMDIMYHITFEWYGDPDKVNHDLCIDADEMASILNDFYTMSKKEVIKEHKWSAYEWQEADV